MTAITRPTTSRGYPLPPVGRPTALFRVRTSIAHPVTAVEDDVLTWYPAVAIEVWRILDDEWVCVQALEFDNAGSLAGLLADYAIEHVADGAAERAGFPKLPAPLFTPKARRT